MTAELISNFKYFTININIKVTDKAYQNKYNFVKCATTSGKENQT